MIENLLGTRVGFALALLSVVGLSGCGSDSSPGGGSGGSGGADPNLAKFSFFVISVESARAVSGSADGFGGDLRFGETGAGAGLRGADKICAAVAEKGMAGAGKKTWRAFLSATSDGSGSPVHAKDRVGTGPWYDANGRQVASTLAQLLMDRPGDADLAIRNDLPNEHGIPNHADGTNNHAVLTGTGPDGTLYTVTTPTSDNTCDDWTSKEASGHPWCGHSWPRTGSGTNWMSSSAVSGCAPCTGTGTNCVGSTGGYGGFYCFAIN